MAAKTMMPTTRSSMVDSDVARSQREVLEICTEMYSAIIRVLPAPSRAGVTRKPSEKTNTNSVANAMPGRLSGSQTSQKIVAGRAPSDRAA